MAFLRCGNQLIYVVAICVRTKVASSAHAPSAKQLRGSQVGSCVAAGYSLCVHGHCHAGDKAWLWGNQIKLEVQIST